jgi:hypothetical protein
MPGPETPCTSLVLRKWLVAAGAAAACLGVLPMARAADTKAPQDAPALPPTLAVRASPLPLLYATTSLEIELFVCRHLGVVVSPQYTSSSTSYAPTLDNDYQTTVDTFQGFGSELGIRVYPAGMSKGTAAFFFGPSAIVGGYEWSSTVSSTLPSRVGLTRAGLALDLGVSYAAPFGFALAAGAGVQYAADSSDPDYGRGGGSPADGIFEALAFGSGVRPRLLLSLGLALERSVARAFWRAGAGARPAPPGRGRDPAPRADSG